MSNMTDIESMERVREGLKKSADRFRKLSLLNGDREWTQLAFKLEKILKRAEDEFKRICPEAEVQQIIDEMMKKHKTTEDSVH